ncbi:formyl transferase [Pedobacter immunditicola]|uniref:formyl transferase n=1 Tax=Pedobacter immunditicola TaxID=3133440 RepID=UPI0030A7285E
MKPQKIVILAGKGKSSYILYNALRQEFQIHSIILEEGTPTSVFLKRRLKKLGLFKVSGQILFKVLALPLIQLESRKRYRELWNSFGFDTTLDPAKDPVEYVDSVNSKQTLALLKAIEPDLVIVNGTRIISKNVLQNIPCKFINTHVGITPKYRGVHGAYWALVNNDPENCGVTVHFVDQGIDTGQVIYQENIRPTVKDTFVTYPLLQLNVGIGLVKKAVSAVLEGAVDVKKPGLESKLWSHPTLIDYLKFRLLKQVK